jgi:hypothetical protein
VPYREASVSDLSLVLKFRIFVAVLLRLGGSVERQEQCQNFVIKWLQAGRDCES